MKNLFISFEGIDGCGKDTQLNKFMIYLKEKDKYLNVWITREPTKITKYGEKISNLLINSKKILDKKITTRLYVKDRILHSKIIKKQLKHSFVLTSRFDLSTFNYQNIQGYPFDELYKMHRYNKMFGCLIPDLTIVFDVDVKISQNRLNNRFNQEKEFFEKIDFQKKIAKNQKKIINILKKKDKRNFIIVNANNSIEKVYNEMIEKFEKFLKEKEL